MANKDPERRAATRRRIVDAFWNLYEDTPIERIGVAQVASAAGVHRSTFYEYFRDVYDVRDSIEGEVLAYMGEKARSIVAAGGSGNLEECVREMLEEKGRFLAVLYVSGASPSFARRAKAQLTSVIASSEGYAGISRYEAEFVASGLIGAYVLWFERGQDVPVEQVVSELGRMALRCLAEPPSPD